MTSTDPIDPAYDSKVKDYDLYVEAFVGVPPPAEGDVLVSGTITSAVAGVQASDVEISASEAQCDRTNTGFECVVSAAANNPKLTVNNYQKNNVNLLGCSTMLVTHGQEQSTNSWTRFYLPSVTTSNADIVIKKDSC